MVSRPRHIVGVQIHHSVNLDDASRFAANALTALGGAIAKTDDPGLVALRDQGMAWTREIGKWRTAAGERLRGMDPDERRECVEGRAPYPDETPVGFVPRCSCEDRCLHEQGLDPGPNGICNCDRTCLQHPEGGRGASGREWPGGPA